MPWAPEQRLACEDLKEQAQGSLIIPGSQTFLEKKQISGRSQYCAISDLKIARHCEGCCVHERKRKPLLIFVSTTTLNRAVTLTFFALQKLQKS